MFIGHSRVTYLLRIYYESVTNFMNSTEKEKTEGKELLSFGYYLYSEIYQIVSLFYFINLVDPVRNMQENNIYMR